jgi:hypothetical protein
MRSSASYGSCILNAVMDLVLCQPQRDPSVASACSLRMHGEARVMRSSASYLFDKNGKCSVDSGMDRVG